MFGDEVGDLHRETGEGLLEQPNSSAVLLWPACHLNQAVDG
jgi:hypothetical protein